MKIRRKYGAGSTPVEAIHCQLPLFCGGSPSSSSPSKRARRPASRGAGPSSGTSRRRAARGCASSRSRASWRIAASTSGYPVRPSFQAASSAGVVRPTKARRVALLELLARVAGMMQQHVGVEVAPGELADERRRAPRLRGRGALLELARARGSPSAGRARAATCRRRACRAARRSRRSASRQPALERLARRRLARLARTARPARRPSAGLAGSRPSFSPPARGTARRAVNRRGASFCSGAPEGREDGVRRARAGARLRRRRRVVAAGRGRASMPAAPRASVTARSRRRAKGETSLVQKTAPRRSRSRARARTLLGPPCERTRAPTRARAARPSSSRRQPSMNAVRGPAGEAAGEQPLVEHEQRQDAIVLGTAVAEGGMVVQREGRGAARRSRWRRHAAKLRTRIREPGPFVDRRYARPLERDFPLFPLGMVALPVRGRPAAHLRAALQDDDQRVPGAEREFGIVWAGEGEVRAIGCAVEITRSSRSCPTGA